MAIEYLGLAHVAFFAKDYDKMFDFYVNKLGGEYAYHMPRNAWPEGEPFWPEGTKADDVWLTYIRFGNQYIELFNEAHKGETKFGGQSHSHIALEIGNLVCMVERLKKLGVTVYNGPEGPVMDKPVLEYPLGMCNSRCAAWVKDPEGNWIELMQFTPASFQLTCG